MPKQIHTASDPNVDFARLGEFLDQLRINRLVAHVTDSAGMCRVDFASALVECGHASGEPAG